MIGVPPSGPDTGVGSFTAADPVETLYAHSSWTQSGEHASAMLELPAATQLGSSPVWSRLACVAPRARGHAYRPGEFR